VLFLGAAAPVFAAPGPPANDDLTNATVIASLDYSKHENTTNATVEGGELAPSCQDLGSTVWFTWTPDANVGVEANTIGSKAQDGDYDTVLAVWHFNGSSWVLDACSDDDGGGPDGHWSQVTFAAQDGTTYYFQVGDCCSTSATEARHAGLVFNLFAV
jgi:hypothetical protein